MSRVRFEPTAFPRSHTHAHRFRVLLTWPRLPAHRLWPLLYVTACAEQGDEAYSPGGSSSNSNSAPALVAPLAGAAPAAASVLRSKMEELNRQIEEQKQQIMKMAQADSSVGGDVCCKLFNCCRSYCFYVCSVFLD